MATRFSDTYKTIYSFGNHFLVVCPQCERCAEVIACDNTVPRSQPHARLTCLHCGYSAEALLRSYTPGKPEDWYFHRPLWLQAPCAGHTLWAYNLDHLNYIGNYIQADLREKQKDGSGWNSMLNRLPRWMKEARNRNAVMTTIEKLRRSVIDDQ